MSGYTPYYSGGWQSGESGGTPITPAALNNMESGIGAALTAGNVINNLTSTATDKPLSANMGKALNEKYTKIAYTSSELSGISNTAPTTISSSYTIPSGYELFAVNNQRVLGRGNYYDWVVTTQTSFTVNGSTLNMECRAICMGSTATGGSKIYADIILQKI